MVIFFVVILIRVLLFSLSSFLGRGDKRVMGNVRLVQWQVAQIKQEKLEFLMPSWDLQVGISVNQFLVIYASKNADFRSSLSLSLNQICSLLLKLSMGSGSYAS